ncbi:Squalene monooxygenase [Smittium mucronatum]|uniref:Squalene monooxygenase n=1 Tax=Smittium mucronatum TaxID=133383 RepID=A0A1R0GML1_9FUNG|nr:Squalene monooxygenase [Smittium mucronatum]
MSFSVNKLDSPSPYSKYINDRSLIFTCSDKEKLLAEKFDVIVVGAGPIGATIATAMARDGRKVLVVERSWDKPDRIVGELMQPGGVEVLEKLGLGDSFNGISAVPTSGYHVAFKKETVYIPYNIDSKTGQRLKGVSFHHGNFLMSMRGACKAEKNTTCLEAEVKDLLFNDKGDRVLGVVIKPSHWDSNSESSINSGLAEKEKESQHEDFSILAPLTIIADGINSKFRSLNSPTKKPSLKSHFVGFIIKHQDSNPLPCPRNGHVFLTGFTPILMYQVSDTETRVLVDVPGTKLPNQSTGALRKYIEAAGKSLPEAAKEAYLKSVADTKRLKVMTNSSYPSQKIHINGAAFVGDSYNMRHPLTGGGMTVGLWDCYYLSQQLSVKNIPDLSDYEAIRKALDKVYSLRKPRALVINTLSVALYSLFSGDSEPYRNLRDACFKYFLLGGSAVTGPSGLLSGNDTSPYVLAYHFFLVALYAMYLEMKKSDSLFSIFYHFFNALYTLLVAAYIFLPLIAEERNLTHFIFTDTQELASPRIYIKQTFYGISRIFQVRFQ